jgi:hypothetical protein
MRRSNYGYFKPMGPRLNFIEVRDSKLWNARMEGETKRECPMFVCGGLKVPNKMRDARGIAKPQAAFR